MKLLLIEHVPQRARLLAGVLERHGYRVDVAQGSAAADLALGADAYSAVVFDVEVADKDGVAWLTRLRARGDATPVIVLAARNSPEDRIAGLSAGADDYMVKPIDVAELVARLRAVARRSGPLLSPRLASGNVMLDTQSRQVIVGDMCYGWPPRETAILELLLRSPGSVVLKRFLEDQLYGHSREAGPNATDVYVHRLRKLLASAQASVAVRTVRGVGYFLTDAVNSGAHRR